MHTPDAEHTSRPIVKSTLFDVWWVRILSTLGVLCAAVVVALSFSSDESVLMITVYTAIGGSIIGIELLRHGGSTLSSGLGFSRFTIRQLIGGGGGALLILGIVVSFAVAMGGSVELSGHGIVAAEVGFIAIASAGEEFLFRGTIFEALRERFGAWIAIGSTSLIFGLAHLANPGVSAIAIINVVLAGTILGVMVVQTQSLWMSISFHVAWNTIVRVFIGTVSGHYSEPGVSTLDTSEIAPSLQWLVTGTFGIEEGAITTLLLVGGVIVIISVVHPDRFVRAAKSRVLRSSISRT